VVSLIGLIAIWLSGR